MQAGAHQPPALPNEDAYPPQALPNEDAYFDVEP